MKIRPIILVQADPTEAIENFVQEALNRMENEKIDHYMLCLNDWTFYVRPGHYPDKGEIMNSWYKLKGYR